ncbi:hypothetical protein CEXT_738121 [Caerostris extrusa]|uniref:Uncharacterized protein n=1 Tax=Caerostris extrusa TaxID=172846 RepID=A0AAV4TA55_CAEEX|nr:hypothetical protein CEXT_738121 [Caerostris extrusa]
MAVARRNKAPWKEGGGGSNLRANEFQLATYNAIMVFNKNLTNEGAENLQSWFLQNLTNVRANEYQLATYNAIMVFNESENLTNEGAGLYQLATYNAIMKIRKLDSNCG